ncbi:hypothetical protein ABW19_dt0203769 [Dactylella cylindrospora]|nr:hypothetical protein ABW19_dt0203769 [Dactylella cylindrospora]
MGRVTGQKGYMRLYKHPDFEEIQDASTPSAISSLNGRAEIRFEAATEIGFQRYLEYHNISPTRAEFQTAGYRLHNDIQDCSLPQFTPAPRALDEATLGLPVEFLKVVDSTSLGTRSATPSSDSSIELPPFPPAVPPKIPLDGGPLPDLSYEETPPPILLLFRPIATRWNPQEKITEYQLVYKTSRNQPDFPNCRASKEWFHFNHLCQWKVVVDRLRLWHRMNPFKLKDPRVDDEKYNISWAELTETHNHAWPGYIEREWTRCLIKEYLE